MIFGKSNEEMNQKRDRYYKERKWFAWHPVRLVNGCWVWLEYVWKNYSSACGGGWRYDINYKLKEKK